MKLIIGLLFASCAFTSHAQVPKVKATATTGGGQVVMSKKAKAANSQANVNTLERTQILGNFQIDTIYTYNEDYTEGDLPDFAINDTIRIVKDKILLKDGNHEFRVFDSQEMPVGDYFYRMFLITGDDYPEELPKKIAVHKTDNPHIYGIGVLKNGKILMPFEGQLIMLKEIIPATK